MSKLIDYEIIITDNSSKNSNSDNLIKKLPRDERIKLSDLHIDELNKYGNNAIKFYEKNFNNETIISELIKYL